MGLKLSSTRQTNPLQSVRAKVTLVPLAVFFLGGVCYAVWDNWWVNWDGGFYLYIARSILEGGGPSLPDGSPAVFRGPGYPTLFAASWTVFDVSAKTAIWVSRGALLAGGGMVAWIVARKASLVGSVFAGLAAVVPAIILESGGWYFVPDGLAAVLVLGSIVSVVSGRTVPGIGRGVLAGLLMAAAILTKETAVLYSPTVLLVVWSRLERGKPEGLRAIGGYVISLSALLASWLWWTVALSGSEAPRFIPIPLGWAGVLGAGVVLAGGALLFISRRVSGDVAPASARILAGVGFPLAVLGAALALKVAGEPTVASVTASFVRLGDELVSFMGWSWIPALIIIALVVVQGRRIPGTAAPLWLAGVLLLGVGLGQMWYAASAHLSMRNGVGAALGLAILVGTSVWSFRTARGQVLASMAAGVFLLTAGFATAEVDANKPSGTQNWDNPAVHELRLWLSESSIDAATFTPIYATYLYFLGDDLPEPHLLEWHFAPRGGEMYHPEGFCKRIWWAADRPLCPSGTKLRVVQANRRIATALFAGAIAEAPGRPLVVTGHTAHSAFNGTGLLYLIEKYDLGVPLFATSEDDLPNWAVVYDIDWERWNAESIPAVVEPGVTGFDLMAAEIVPIDRGEFLSLLRGVLRP